MVLQQNQASTARIGLLQFRSTLCYSLLIGVFAEKTQLRCLCMCRGALEKWKHKLTRDCWVLRTEISGPELGIIRGSDLRKCCHLAQRA